MRDHLRLDTGQPAATITSFAVDQNGNCTWLNPGNPTGALYVVDATSGFASGALAATTVSYALPAGKWAAGDTVNLIRVQNTFTATIPAVKTVAPAIIAPYPAVTCGGSGEFEVGDVLTTTLGTFTGTPTPTLTVQWGQTVSEGDVPAIVPIAGATGSTYTIQSSDVGTFLVSVVTGTNSAGTAAAYGWTPSAVTAVPPPPPPPAAPANTTLPAITGTVAVGSTLTASDGSWTNSPTAFSFQWNRAGTPISGATAGTYVVQAADEGSALSVTVTASNSAGAVSATSAATVTVPVPTPPSGDSWGDGFETGNFNNESVHLFGTNVEATVEVVKSGQTGVTGSAAPTAHGGNYMCHFQVTEAQKAANLIQSKLYKIWNSSKAPSKFTEDGGTLAPNMPPGNDISGHYSCWYYLQPTYERDPNYGNWTVMWQWKQWFADQQIVNWGICISAAYQWNGAKTPQGTNQYTPVGSEGYGNQPVMHIQGGGIPSFANWDYMVRDVPRGEWFQISADLDQVAQTISFYINGVLWRTVTATMKSGFPIGAVALPPETTAPNYSIFGPGHYDGIGELWVDDIAVTFKN